jgi:hypothetical protein
MSTNYKSSSEYLLGWQQEDKIYKCPAPAHAFHTIHHFAPPLKGFNSLR